MPSILAIVSKAIFESMKPLPSLGKVAALDGYDSKTKALNALTPKDSLFLVTVRPGEKLWLVAVLEGLSFTGTRWAAEKANSTQVTDISSLRDKIKFDSGKGITQEVGKLGMSLQSPRALSANDVKILLGAVGGQVPSSVPEAVPAKREAPTPKKSTAKAAKAPVAAAKPTKPAPAASPVVKTADPVATTLATASLAPRRLPEPVHVENSGVPPLRLPEPPEGRSIAYDLATAILASPRPSALSNEQRDTLLAKIVGKRAHGPQPGRAGALDAFAATADEAAWDWVLARWLLRAHYDDGFMGHFSRVYFAAMLSKAPDTELVRALKPLVVEVIIQCSELSPAVFDLPALRELHIGHGLLEGGLNLSRLPSLECLKVSFSGTDKKWDEQVGSISAQLRAVKGAATLRQLHFECYQAATPPALEGSVFDKIHLTGRGYTRLTGLSEVCELSVNYGPELKGVLELAGCTRLRKFSGNLQGLRSLEGLQEVPLETLSLVSVKALTSLDGLNAETLQHVSVRGAKVLSSLVRVSAATRLRTLELQGAEGVLEVATLQTTALESVHLEGLGKLDQSAFDCLFAAGPHRLREVRFVDCPKLKRIDTVLWEGIEVLDLRGCSGINALPGLERFTKLRHLKLCGTRFEPADIPAELRPIATWAKEPDEELMGRYRGRSYAE